MVQIIQRHSYKDRQYIQTNLPEFSNFMKFLLDIDIVDTSQCKLFLFNSPQVLCMDSSFCAIMNRTLQYDLQVDDSTHQHPI